MQIKINLFTAIFFLTLSPIYSPDLKLLIFNLLFLQKEMFCCQSADISDDV